MRILIFSDTHGDARVMPRVVAAEKCSLVLHLGDCVADCDALRREFPMIPVWQVAGNDFRDRLSGVQDDYTFELEGVRVFMTHGDRYGGTAETVCAAAEARGAAVALFGHTHVAATGVFGGAAFMNPGSPARPRDGRASYGVLTLENGEFSMEIVRL
jgi:putative phosphoesterase